MSYSGSIQDDPSSNSSSPLSTSISQTQSSISSNTSNSNCIRSLSLVDFVDFKFEGNISKNALALGDCDNDTNNELAVGTLNGELLIYKNDSMHPHAYAKDLGMIASVLIGDIINKNMNYIISLSIEGYLNILQICNQIDMQNPTETNHTRKHSKFVNSTSNVKLPPTIADNEIYSYKAKLTVVHCQQIQANAMCAMLVDFDHDGNNEYIVALSDRVVRCYRAILFNEDIKLIGLYKWEFSDQIGSITLHNSSVDLATKDDNDKVNSCKKKSILVTQFGGVYATITCCDNVDNENMKSEEIERTVEYCNTIVPFVRNRQTSSEIMSNIKNNINENLIVIATHDGTVILLNDQTIKWKLHLEYPILSINKHDLTNDGCDELIICVWSGLTYIIDLDGNIVQNHFHEPISTFTAGHYHLYDKKVNCFIYATFTNTVRLYHNIDPKMFSINTNYNYLLKNIETDSKLWNDLNMLAKDLIASRSDDDKNANNNDEINEIMPELIRTLLYEISINDAEKESTDSS